jgi:translation elongation factor EF-Tu-like GTPase
MLTWNDVAKKIENMTPEQRATNIISSAENFRMILSKICKDAYSAVLDGVLTKEELFTLLEHTNSFRMSLITVNENDLVMPIENVYGNVLVGRLEKNIKAGATVKIVTRIGIYSSVINKIHMYSKTYEQGFMGSAVGLELKDIEGDIRGGDKVYLE